MSAWISVKERLPTDAETVLIHGKDKHGGVYTDVGYFVPLGSRTWYSLRTAGTVTHWQPLPEPPEKR